MTNQFKKIAIIAAFGMLPCAAFATPTVTFQGEVTDQTCSVSINGQTSSVVMLPTVATTDFGPTLANGQTAGLTPFTVSISDCTAPATDINIATKFLGYDVDTGSGGSGQPRNQRCRRRIWYSVNGFKRWFKSGSALWPNGC